MSLLTRWRWDPAQHQPGFGEVKRMPLGCGGTEVIS
jgi:hypothetical protein